MLARRLATSLLPRCRPYSTSSALLNHTPSLADIRHDNASEFDRRQHEFREATRAARKAKAEQDSQFVRSSKQAYAQALDSSSSSSSSSPASSAATGSEAAAAAPPASDASTGTASIASGIVSDLKQKLSLGTSSHSGSSTAETAREQTSAAETSKRKGALASLIYGTKEGQQLDQEIERSFSQVLARGKYVHSIVFHTVKPDKVDEYVKLVGEWYPRVAGTEQNHVHLVGSWRTEVGDCDTFGEKTISLLLTQGSELLSFLDGGMLVRYGTALQSTANQVFIC